MKQLILIVLMLFAHVCSAQSLPKVAKSNLDYRTLDSSYSVIIYQDSNNTEMDWFATAANDELKERGFNNVTTIKTDLSNVALSPREMAFYSLPDKKQYQIWFKKK